MILQWRMVLREGFAPPTQAFSGLCSTPELPRHKFYSLKVTRPLERSYGDIATRTLSPVSIRILFFLNLPEITAFTSCPLSKSILKEACGSNSKTFPSYSKISSFGNLFFLHSFFYRPTVTYKAFKFA